MSNVVSGVVSGVGEANEGAGVEDAVGAIGEGR
jgi:hypothetical protein